MRHLLSWKRQHVSALHETASSVWGMQGVRVHVATQCCSEHTTSTSGYRCLKPLTVTETRWAPLWPVTALMLKSTAWVTPSVSAVPQHRQRLSLPTSAGASDRVVAQIFKWSRHIQLVLIRSVQQVCYVCYRPVECLNSVSTAFWWLCQHIITKFTETWSRPRT